MAENLEQLDQLIDDLRHAAATENWDRLSELHEAVQPNVARVMNAVATGAYSADVVRQRLEELRRVCDLGLQGAQAARAAAKTALDEMRQNRQAVSAYHKIAMNQLK
ncbi:hypothetical protein [Marinobacter sp. X15-166B]|uniref:hypothetical protein n=1 Tax=Marinobacter sp. X15-166B TaxID=1897620 RepID=UPI00085C2AC9|nr:hypothetical protein [Marinobacter sp. X15-166B]OEY67059.1 hypothetical protein BG841_11730 [Marinobacter sp. X15-166B]